MCLDHLHILPMETILRRSIQDVQDGQTTWLLARGCLKAPCLQANSPLDRHASKQKKQHTSRQTHHAAKPACKLVAVDHSCDNSGPQLKRPVLRPVSVLTSFSLFLVGQSSERSETLSSLQDCSNAQVLPCKLQLQGSRQNMA